MNAKEQKIKEAYGEFYNELKPYMCENGWTLSGAKMGQFKNEDLQFDEMYSSGRATLIDTFRPKSLQGIEDNNGWEIINSMSDIPINDYMLYNAYQIDKSILWNQSEVLNSVGLKQAFSEGKIYHYRNLKKDPPPIY